MLSTHEIEDILDRFRVWLHGVNEELDQPEIIALAEQLLEPGSSQCGTCSQETVGLLQVAEAFTALRQEIKLQTKGLRGLQGHVRANQAALEGAIEEFQNDRQESLKTADESAIATARPLIMGLLDVDEAVGQAVKTVETALERSRHVRHLVIDELERGFHQLPAWKRMLLKGYWQRERRRLEEARELAEPSNPTEILEGLRLLQVRVRRVLSEAEVERTQAIGNRVEPRTMQVIEVIEDASRPPETVVDEIRAGYQWKGTTLRPSEVRATKSEVNSKC